MQQKQIQLSIIAELLWILFFFYNFSSLYIFYTAQLVKYSTLSPSVSVFPLFNYKKQYSIW